MQLIAGWSVWDRVRDSNHWGALRVYTLQDAFYGKRIGQPPVSDSETSQTDDDDEEGEEDDGVRLAAAMGNDQLMGDGDASLEPEFAHAHSVGSSHSSWVTSSHTESSASMSPSADEHQFPPAPASNSTPYFGSADDPVIDTAEEAEKLWEYSTQLQLNPNANQKQDDKHGRCNSSSSGNTTSSSSYSVHETISCAVHVNH